MFEIELPRLLDIAHDRSVEPVMRVQHVRRFAPEEDGPWRGVDEGEEHVTRDLPEIHPRDELLERLEARVDRLTVKLVVECGRGEVAALCLSDR